MKVYTGEPGFTIRVRDGERSYRLKPRGYFSTGFCWGRGQPCASEAALCILADAIGFKRAALLHTVFKWDVVVKKLRGIGWVLHENQIREWARGRKKYLRKMDLTGGLYSEGVHYE